MIRFTAIALLGLLTAGCALPFGSSAPLGSTPAARLTGTASLVVTTPYGTSRAVAALQGLQGTVEPANLGNLFDHVTVILDSAAQPDVTKTVSAGQASLVRLDGLFEASDWTLSVTAYDASNAPVAQYLGNEGGISTLKGQVTTIGDVFLNPIPGPGTADFQLDLLDMPTNLNPGKTTWSLEPLNADGTLGTALSTSDKAKVTTVWTGRQFTLGTASGQKLPTGSYRLTLHFEDMAGTPLSFAPIFVVNLFSGLTSTKTFSASAWPDPLPAPSITFPYEETTSNAGIVVTWQPNEPAAVVGYEYFWIPNTSTLPDFNVVDPLFFFRPGTKSGFIPASATNPLRPSWIRSAALIPTDQVVASDWGFYVRAVTVSGAKGPWASSTVAVDVSFSVVLDSVSLPGAPKGHYELRRIGPAAQYPVGIAPDGLVHPEIASYPALGRFAFDVEDPSAGVQTHGFEPWVLAPGQQLVLETDNGTVPVRIGFDRTHPAQPPTTVWLYLTEETKYDSLADETVVETVYTALTAPLPTLAAPGTEWTFRMPGPTQVESQITSSALAPVTEGYLQGSSLKFQVMPLNWVDAKSEFQPLPSKAKTFAPNAWTGMNWTGGNEAEATYTVTARPVWDLGAAGLLYGAWSGLGMSPGVSVAPADVQLNASTGVLNWEEVDDGTWIGAAVTGYKVTKVGVGTLATVTHEELEFDVSGYLPGDFTVSTVFQRADGRIGSSTPAEWPARVALSGSVMADDQGRRPDNGSHTPDSARGRYTDLAEDLYSEGWLVSGYSGAASEVFLSRHTVKGALDTVFGLYSGTVMPGGGFYFADSMGFVQDPSEPVPLVMNASVQNGVGNHVFRGFTFLGIPVTGYNDNAGSRVFAGVGGGIDQEPAGRLVKDPITHQVFSLMWDGGLNGGSNNYGVTRVNFDGTAPAQAWLNTDYLHRLAVKDSTTLLAIGNAGLIKRIYMNSLSLDTTNDLTIWDELGVATVTVDSVTPDWKDIAVQSDGKIVLTGWSSTNASGYVVRLLSDGTLDPTFNITDGTGWVKLPGLCPYDLAVLPVIYDVAVVGDNSAVPDANVTGFLRVFNAAGITTLSNALVGPTSLGAGARAVAYSAAGRLMAAGFTRVSDTQFDTDTIPALWRF